MHDLRLLTVLREVALRGSFSAAAEALAYTQPAVSQQIARLEKQVGVKLIEREPRGIRLTPAGEVLVRHTERIIAQLAAADEELLAVAEQARGRLRIGSFATAAGTLVPRAVAQFRRLRPAVEVEISLLDPHESIPAVRRGDLAGRGGDQDLAGQRAGGIEGGKAAEVVGVDGAGGADEAGGHGGAPMGAAGGDGDTVPAGSHKLK